MKYPKIPLAQTVVALCKAKGIKNIVISPGSRNAPLTIGFTENSFFNCYSIVDERCAAFYALGMAQQLQEPVAVVCTSGSALLNYYPAIAEAFYSNIPVVVLSADRPSYRIDIGDGQTIRQDDVFHRHILCAENLQQDVDHAPEQILAKDKHRLPKFVTKDLLISLQREVQDSNEVAVNRALNIAFEKSGPVHLNIPMEEPLYETVESSLLTPKNIPQGNVDSVLEENELLSFRSKWEKAKRKLVLVGVLSPNSVEQRYLELLAKDESVVVLTESTSNLHHPAFFPSIDKVIAPIEKLANKEEEFERLRPELLLTFGGLVVSKKIKAFLRKFQPEDHWHVDVQKAYDTFFCLKKHFKLTPNFFFKEFLSLETINSDYKAIWEILKKQRAIGHENYLRSIPFCDFKAFEIILDHLPANSNLQLSNSSTIRYVQLFDQSPSIFQFCNRGTSGIDGSSSTAVGAAVVSSRPTTLITGDLSFFYDSNAFWNSYIPASFRVIVINNGGGGIFRILPGNKDTTNFDTYFETKHELNAQHLAAQYNIGYQSAASVKTMVDGLKDFFSISTKPKIMEIFTKESENDKFLTEYFSHLTEIT